MCSSAYQLLGETPLQCWCPQNLRTVLRGPQQSALFGAFTRPGCARHGSRETLQPGFAAPGSRGAGDATLQADLILTGSIGCALGRRAPGSAIHRAGARCALRGAPGTRHPDPSPSASRIGGSAARCAVWTAALDSQWQPPDDWRSIEVADSDDVTVPHSTKIDRPIAMQRALPATAAVPPAEERSTVRYRAPLDARSVSSANEAIRACIAARRNSAGREPRQHGVDRLANRVGRMHDVLMRQWLLSPAVPHRPVRPGIKHIDRQGPLAVARDGDL